MVFPVKGCRTKVNQTNFRTLDLPNILPLPRIVGYFPVGRGEENILRFQVSVGQPGEGRSGRDVLLPRTCTRGGT